MARLSYTDPGLPRVKAPRIKTPAALLDTLRQARRASVLKTFTDHGPRFSIDGCDVDPEAVGTCVADGSLVPQDPGLLPEVPQTFRLS